MKSNDNILSLGEMIASYRKEKGYSQRKFAQISGLSNTTISRIENGETAHPDTETLKLIAFYLNMDESKLLGSIHPSAKPPTPAARARLKYLQQPVRKINRYSTVATVPCTPLEAELHEEAIAAPVPEPPCSPIPVEKAAIKGMKLITLRLENNITQKELADALGLDKTLISQYEGEILQPDLTTVHRMADFFGVSADYLLGAQKPAKEIPVLAEPVEAPLYKAGKTKNMDEELRPEYLQLALDMQDSAIDVKDVRIFLDMLLKYKK